MEPLQPSLSTQRSANQQQGKKGPKSCRFQNIRIDAGVNYEIVLLEILTTLKKVKKNTSLKKEMNEELNFKERKGEKLRHSGEKVEMCPVST
jgi:hypothetical protein